ncbi:MAG: hypothetical protein IT292_04590 [Deltaproteobacteria bacterium]|nr:hypothetical protein [Deltaproteobacteria bacterium]
MERVFTYQDIQTVYVSAEAAEDQLSKRILGRLGTNVQIIKYPSSKDPLATSAALEQDARMAEGKQTLLLTRYKGNWLKACPGTARHICCNLYVVNQAEGCPLDCTYCILQAYLRRNPTLKIYTNTENLMATVQQRLEAEPSRLFRVCTGEMGDSLVWDNLTDFSLSMVPLFARLENGVLELKTKTANINNLLTLKNEHQGKTVVSWSLNAKSVTEHDELGAHPLKERLKAAALAAEAGYRVGFHFDPIVHFSGWQDEYRETIKSIFEHVRPSQVAWISLSTLRYHKDLQSIMIARFPESKLPYGEQFLAKDYKIRYLQPIRLKMLRFMWQELKSVAANIPVYFCMESPAVWRAVSGGLPIAGSEIKEIYCVGRAGLCSCNDDLRR